MGRPASSVEAMLAAADALLRGDIAELPTMDDIARAAGVGKGTLFRAFGDRDGLLEALTATKFQPLRDATELPGSETGPGIAPRERALAFLDAVLTFKIDNRNLMRAREGRGGGDLQSERYRWMREFLRARITEALPGTTDREAAYLSHALLAAIRIDLVEALISEGQSPDDLRHEHTRHASAALGPRRESTDRADI